MSLLLTGAGRHQVPAGGGSEATVTFISANTHNKQASGASGVSAANHTVAAGSNRALVAVLSFDGVVPTGVAVVWDQPGANQAMTKIADVNNGSNAAVQIWGLAAPAVTTSQALTTWTGGANVFLQLVSFTDVDQTTPFPNFNTGTNVTTVNVTSAANRKVVGGIASTGDPGGVTGTPIYYNSSGGTVIYAGASYDTGAGTKAIGATGTASCVAAIDLKGA